MASAPEPSRRRADREATVRTTHWPGWIWAVPVAAVAIVVWLLVRAISAGGTAITIAFDDATGLAANGTTVTYRGVVVGHVTDVSVARGDSGVAVTASIDPVMKHALSTGTRFYLTGTRPTLGDLASLKSILSGPTLVMLPGSGPAARRYRGIVGSPDDSIHPVARYLVYPDGPAGALRAGSIVRLRGFPVGLVTHTALETDAPSGSVSTTVTIGIDPSRLGVANVMSRTHEDPVTATNTVLNDLVRHGLRAHLVRNPPVIGEPAIALDELPDVPAESLALGGALPEIPAAPGSGLDQLVTRLDAVPVRQIGENVRVVTRRLRTLVSSPQLEGAIDNLDRTLASLDTTVRNVGPQLPPMIRKLGQTADQLDATATTVRRVTGGSMATPNGNLEQALNEMTEAARALRGLANFLDQHPEALIRGRGR
jgi:paraquat-inducible protein B